MSKVWKISVQVMFVCFWWMGFLSHGLSQPAANPYYFEGDDIVFVFDVRRYAEALKGKNADKVDFADLNIYDVAISGQFNGWSKKGWKMTKKSEFLFELRKRIDEFNQPFPLEFRYIINGKFINPPGDGDPASRQFTDDFLQDVYKLDLSVIRVHEFGEILFSLKGYTQAQQVILAGSFNGWDEQAIKMNKVPGGWELRADLPPGRYEYKFIADGEWLHDPVVKEKVMNEHGTFNTVLYVKEAIKFTLEGFPNAKSVVLTGSFVDWDEKKLKMMLVNGVWTITVPLTGGKHHYKFIVDGQWFTDPANPVVEDDGKGHLNSALFVH